MRCVLIIFLLTTWWSNASSQNPCGPAWLKQQRNTGMSSSPTWDDYTGASVRKLFHSDYFNIPSDKDYNITLKLNAGKHYTILYYTGIDAQASGVELRDQTGLRLEFEKVYGKSTNNWLEVTYEASRSGNYTLIVRSIFPSDHSSCAALLVREWDDQEWEEKSESEDSGD